MTSTLHDSSALICTDITIQSLYDSPDAMSSYVSTIFSNQYVANQVVTEDSVAVRLECQFVRTIWGTKNWPVHRTAMNVPVLILTHLSKQLSSLYVRQ